MKEHMSGSLEMEKTHEIAGKFIGRMGDLGIGNPDGIPSKYAVTDAETLNAKAEQDARELREPTDLLCEACIDGRHTLSNADGSSAKIRLRRVGGSASNFGVALNAEASILNTIDSAASLGRQIKAVDSYMGERSAHQGGCGGAGGEISDHDLINSNPAILAATLALMDIPEVQEFLGVGYDAGLGERVRQNAAKTAAFLRANGWDGQKYVDGVTAENPRGVESLAVDHDDKKFHGHKESTIVIILGNKTSDKDDEFVWNLKASKEAAEKLAGQRGREGYQQALIAEVAKHLAVSHRLASTETPIELLVA